MIDPETIKLIIQGGLAGLLALIVSLIFKVALPRMMDLFSAQLKAQQDLFRTQLSEQRGDFLNHLAQSRQDFVANEESKRRELVSAMSSNTTSMDRLTRTISEKVKA